MVDKMIADHVLDPSRVYLSGLSGGASMVPVMLATYPDRFAGGAMIGGVPYKCATDVLELLGCMSGENKNPKTWGDRVRKASDHQGPWPKVSIWHGSRDSVVDPDKPRRASSSGPMSTASPKSRPVAKPSTATAARCSRRTAHR
jgi:poly(hydroxyalkanoate) depolymerase family esterase